MHIQSLWGFQSDRQAHVRYCTQASTFFLVHPANTSRIEAEDEPFGCSENTKGGDNKMRWSTHTLPFFFHPTWTRGGIKSSFCRCLCLHAMGRSKLINDLGHLSPRSENGLIKSKQDKVSANYRAHTTLQIPHTRNLAYVAICSFVAVFCSSDRPLMKQPIEFALHLCNKGYLG